MDKIIIAEQGNVPVLSESEKCPNRPHQSELIFSEFNQNLNNLYLYTMQFLKVTGHQNTYILPFCLKAIYITRR